MAKYRKVDGHWEIIEGSIETNSINPIEKEEAEKEINEKLNPDILSEFINPDSATDFIIRLFIPRYYNNGNKVSPDVIADIMAKISETLGGASTWAGKEYWIDDNILYEDKNIYVDIVAHEISPDKASLLGKYLSLVIGKALNQKGVLYFMHPIYSEYLDVPEENEYKKQLDEIRNKIDEIENSSNRNGNDELQPE